MSSTEPKLAIRAHKRSYLIYGSETKTYRDIFRGWGMKWNGTLQGWILGRTKKAELAELTKLIVSLGETPAIGIDTSGDAVSAAAAPVEDSSSTIEMGVEMTNAKGIKIQVVMVEKNNGIVTSFIGSDKKKYITTQFGWLCLEDVNEIVMKN